MKVYDGGWVVSNKCPKCNKFVKLDDAIEVNSQGLKDIPNATCKKCGRVKAEILEGGDLCCTYR